MATPSLITVAGGGRVGKSLLNGKALTLDLSALQTGLSYTEALLLYPPLPHVTGHEALDWTTE